MVRKNDIVQRKEVGGLATTIMKTMKTKKTIKPHRTHDKATIESFRRDRKFAAAYLRAVLNDGNRTEIMTALQYSDRASTK